MIPCCEVRNSKLEALIFLSRENCFKTDKREETLDQSRDDGVADAPPRPGRSACQQNSVGAFALPSNAPKSPREVTSPANCQLSRLGMPLDTMSFGLLSDVHIEEYVHVTIRSDPIFKEVHEDSTGEPPPPVAGSLGFVLATRAAGPTKRDPCHSSQPGSDPCICIGSEFASRLACKQPPKAPTLQMAKGVACLPPAHDVTDLVRSGKKTADAGDAGEFVCCE